MIEQSKYLPKQMTGPVVNAEKAALEDRLTDAKAIEDYLYNLSIQSADETELENIGRLVGYPRPLVPEGFADEANLFLFWSLPFEQNALIGFSEVGSEIGGRLSTTKESSTGYMNLGLYRTFLDKVAYVKRYGVTLYAVDQIARLIDDAYTIEWNEDKDIEVTFERYIGFQNLWILSQLFLRIATSPQVIIYSYPEEE
jgi:hypothetical protein